MSKTILPINYPKELIIIDEHNNLNFFENLMAQLPIFMTLKDPKEINEIFLEALAKVKKSDIFFILESATIDKKREILLHQNFLHRKKGTTGAIKKALSFVGVNVEIKEWFDYGGLPYHFFIQLNIENSIELNKDNYKKIDYLIKNYKNIRSVCEKIEVSKDFQISKQAGLIVSCGEVIEIGFVNHISITLSNSIGIGVETIEISKDFQISKQAGLIVSCGEVIEIGFVNNISMTLSNSIGIGVETIEKGENIE